MSYGDVPEHANDYSEASLKLPRGVIINGNLAEIFPVDLADPEQIQEFVPHSWYKYADESKGLHPWDGVTEPHYELGPNSKGTKTNIEQLDEGGKYSWIKAPRWRGMRWKSAHLPAGSSAMPRTSLSSRSRSTSC